MKSGDTTNPAGFKQTEAGVIPDDWTCLSVGDLFRDGIIEKPMDGNHGAIHPKSGDFVDSGIPFVMANDVQNGIVHFQRCSFIRKEQADSLMKGFAKRGDVLLTHKATMGNTAIVGDIPWDYIMLTPQVTYYRVADHTRLSNRFLRHFFDGSAFQQKLEVLSGGGTRSYLGIVGQHQLQVALPPTLAEQEAIAEALGDADAWIESLEQLIAKKRHLKQAAMQQLLTPTEAWSTTTLGDIADPTKRWSFTGGPFGSNLKSADYTSDGVQIIQLQNIGDGAFKNDYKIYTTDDKADDLLSCNVYPGDLILSKMGDPVARACIIPNLQPRYLMCSDGIRLAVDKKRFDTFFVFTLINGQDFRTKAENAGTGSTRKRIGLSELRNLELQCPSLAEQTKIARVLADMDADIVATESKLTKARQIKQGMMQELLTGRTRLI